MIELEIQGLSESRKGLLMEVGRLALASGFALQRQRLVQGEHGILLSVIVRGPPRARRTLEAALDGCDRFISVKVFPYTEDEPRPHFAISHKRARPTVVAPPAPAGPAFTPAVPVATPSPGVASPPAPRQAASPEPEFEFIQPTPRPPAPVKSVETALFVEPVALAPDEAAVDKALRDLERDYPRVLPQLLALRHAVAADAREPSLALAGRRVGTWVFGREYALDGGLDLREAVERLGIPALRALVEVDQQGMQLHIHDSPLCAEEGQSGCGFFSGFLEGLLGPAIAPGGLSIFPVCCRSYGADECVLAISD
ncbi:MULTISPECIES: hypothetical protein [unclassified Rhodanobacter]|uniref:hypothetical protein n=1 Tax=unclassified Rhodanobacter TaxID=2621553 RepID=UPI001BE11070|nr:MULTISPECIES: hypothetical protein [unclassified Rhodanobacter]MBT2145475.1 hypothetical protein [Rhodanobacter sp. LX-99]MBT2149520.1 hypothetical protein [Rhodanobacter sp. LX-100]